MFYNIFFVYMIFSTFTNKIKYIHVNTPITIRERMMVFIHHIGLSIQSFSYRCRLSQPAILKLNENSQNGTFAKIYTAFPELNPRWLQYGEGEMIRPAATNSDEASSQSASSEDYIIFSQEEVKNSLIEFSKAIRLVNKQMELYAESIAQKDEQISRLLAMIEEKDKMMAKLTEKL